MYSLINLIEDKTSDADYVLYILESIDPQLLAGEVVQDYLTQIRFIKAERFELLKLLLKNILFLKSERFPSVLSIINLSLFASLDKSNFNEDSLVKLDTLFSIMRMVYDYGRYFNPKFK